LDENSTYNLNVEKEVSDTGSENSYKIRERLSGAL